MKFFIDLLPLTEELRDMERDTHRVMHTKIKRGGGKRKEEDDVQALDW